MVEIGFFVKKHFDPKLFWTPTNLSKNFLVLNMFGSMKLDPKLCYHKTILGSKKNWVQKKLGPKICLVKKSLVQNSFSNSWDIAKNDKSLQVTCCLDKFHHDSWHLLQIVPKSWLWSLVKIGSVTAEILLIWTNVARTNVAWTNIHITIVLDCQEWMGNNIC